MSNISEHADCVARREHPISRDPMERTNAAFVEFAGSTVLAADIIDKIGVDWRFSFLVGAAATTAMETAKNKFRSD